MGLWKIRDSGGQLDVSQLSGHFKENERPDDRGDGGGSWQLAVTVAEKDLPGGG